MEIDSKHKWEIFLTDFDKALLPDIKKINSSKNFKFTTGTYSLYNNLPKLKTDKKLDVILSTYTFDNLWLTDDLHLTKIGNVWYKTLYKLDFSKIGKRLEDIEKGKELNKQFFEDLKVKTKLTKINLSSVKYGMHIEKYFKNYKEVSVNHPGGLISTIVSSFNNQLRKQGLFITADIAIADSSKEIKGYKSVNETIRIKIENYALAKYILEKLGFDVELKSVHDFIEEAGVITPIDIYDHFVITVKLRN